jgi:hypothetical protein
MLEESSILKNTPKLLAEKINEELVNENICS